MKKGLLVALAAAVAVAAVVWFGHREETRTVRARLQRTAPVTPLAAAGPAAPPPLLETAVRLIVNRSTRTGTLTRAGVEQIYLGKHTTWPDGEQVVAVMLPEDSEVSKEFLAVFLGKTPEQYRAYWRYEVMSGSPALPRTLRTADEIIAFVAATPGAIGVLDRDPTRDEVVVAPVADVRALEPAPSAATEPGTTAANDPATNDTQTDDPASDESLPETGTETISEVGETSSGR